MERIELLGAEIGRWYSDREGRLFEVVALDDADATIEIQHQDGTLEECDSRGWLELLPQAAEPVEDWSDFLGVAGNADLAGYGKDIEPDWRDALDRLNRLDRLD
ncbi:MAG: DUF6763 family protein [Gammaproteobacteria bacterium]